MSTSNLPPLRNLPNWSRVGTLDKTRYPRLFPRDCSTNAPHLDSTVKGRTFPRAMNSDLTRIASLEKDVIFLQQQHKETLEKLHNEIDALKRENRELQYQLIMETNQLSKESHTASSLQAGGSGSELEPSQCPDGSSLLLAPHGWDGASNIVDHSGAPSQEPEAVGGPLISLDPLRVHSHPSELPRAPTLQECELVIRQLCRANKLQAQELLQLRAVLKDIVLNKKKVSDEAYSQTKAFLSDCPREGYERLPKIAQRPATKIPPQAQASEGERLVLPSIRHSCNSLTERQKRAQAIHKTRLRKTVDS
ncbi:coiled-coil domain-containing protein 74A [Clupea harengus]|uniref:Coiled-coil domain-containing protein 74A n=1 Tax=Clupea harengus TaxID=7950 RepID=A0A8M1KJK6_CLUHA|nr:coiled-coil domain-containing protein 74A [Clupea harengus]